MTYDDERVVALLKESVPAVPEAPTRVDAVRRLARRQRSYRAARAVGAAAALVLLVVMVVVPRAGERPVGPVAKPVEAALAALRERESVTVEVATTVAGQPHLARVKRFVLRRDGTRRIESWLMENPADREESRVVDDVSYRTVEAGERLPPGKRWIRTSHPPPDVESEIRTIERFASALRDVRYVRDTTVRGVRVAEYAATFVDDLPDFAVGGIGPVTFAIDADALPRRLETTWDTDMFGSWRLVFEFFGYDRAVVDPPPPHEVASVDEMMRPDGGSNGADPKFELAVCTGGGRMTRRHLDRCVDEYVARRGGRVTCETSYRRPDDWDYACSDGEASGPYVPRRD